MAEVKPLQHRGIYPRPFGLPRLEPEGRCCNGMVWAEKSGTIAFDRGVGGFTIVNPRELVVTHAGLIPMHRVKISFCPFCGFQYNARCPELQLLDATSTSPAEDPQL